MTLKLLVDLPLEQFCAERLDQLQKITSSRVADSFVVQSSHLTLSVYPENSNAYARWAAFFLSPAVTEVALQRQKQEQKQQETQNSLGEYDFFLYNDVEATRNMSRRLLSMVHSFLAENFAIKGVILLQNSTHCPADIVLLDLSHSPTAAIDHFLDVTSGQLVLSGPEDTVLQTILISDLIFQWDGDIQSSKVAAAIAAPRTHFDWPTCPVCLFRIDPLRLGLPAPQNHQMCSKFCPPPNLGFANSQPSCSRQRLLRPWPSPCRCMACSVVDKHWKIQIQAINQEDPYPRGYLSCYHCDLRETLWVCLTCGFLGCGRYSNKHSVEHFDETGHPYSLELATLRIWDYATGSFAHRADLLDCPSSPPLLNSCLHRGHHHGSGNEVNFNHQGGQAGELIETKSPKKTSMIGEEYEALLQSALEEQALHYEGEITGLRARLAAENLDQNTMTVVEAKEIEDLRKEISSFRVDIEKVGRELLEWQAKEAGHRATSQKLLREQQVATELLNSIKKETVKERTEGKLQVEELEQQIADLTANEQMRNQFSQDEELQQAQIWGTSGSPDDNSRNKKGKKTRRSFRR